jgi:cobalt-zinc-cadmium efflux system outer membrane protein
MRFGSATLLRQIAVSAVLAGCAAPERHDAGTPQPAREDASANASSDVQPATVMPTLAPPTVSAPPRPVSERSSLSLSEALELVASRNVDLLAAQRGVDVVAARQIDAGKPANPELGIFSEDLGERPHHGVVNTQTTLQLSQALPLTGKLTYEQAVARSQRTLADRDYETRRLEILGDTTRAFVGLLVAQRRAALADEQLALVERLAAVEQAQVAAGQVAPYERSRAVAALAEARLRVNEARRDIDVLRQRLSSFWSGDAASLTQVTGDLGRLPPIPAMPKLLARVDATPEIARDAAEIELRRLAVALERSKAVPDLTVTGGVRRHEDEGDYAFVVGVAIPLEIFSSNRSGIAEAAQKQQQAELQLAAAKNHLTAAINEHYARLTSTAAEIEALRTTLIPSSEQSMNALREGYRLRKFRLSELLIAEQSLMALRDKLLTALGSYHQGYADLEQLLGGLDGRRAAGEP